MNLLGTFHVNTTVNERGFTLTELLLSVALFFIIASFLFPISLHVLRTHTLYETTENLLHVLRRAQSMSLTGMNNNSYGVKVHPDSYVLFEGDSYESRRIVSDEVYPLPSSVAITGFDEVVFTALSGTPADAHLLSLSVNEREETIEISALGLITR